jgi:hypothetical protein
MTTLSKAIEIAIQAHQGQKDKSGTEYDKFINRVSENPVAVKVK